MIDVILTLLNIGIFANWAVTNNSVFLFSLRSNIRYPAFNSSSLYWTKRNTSLSSGSKTNSVANDLTSTSLPVSFPVVSFSGSCHWIYTSRAERTFSFFEALSFPEDINTINCVGVVYFDMRVWSISLWNSTSLEKYN